MVNEVPYGSLSGALAGALCGPVYVRVCLTLIPLNELSSAKFLVCFNFSSASMYLKFGKMLSECKRAWIRVRNRFTRRFIRIPAVLYGTIVVISVLVIIKLTKFAVPFRLR